MQIKLIGPENLKEMISKLSSEAFDFSTTEYDDYDVLLWHLGAVDFVIKKSIVLFNSDENRLKENAKVYMISYGHSTKATITISSMKDGKIMICIQRAIQDKYGNIIEPQEFQVNYSGNEDYSTEILACCSLALVCGISISKIQEFEF